MIFLKKKKKAQYWEEMKDLRGLEVNTEDDLLE